MIIKRHIRQNVASSKIASLKKHSHLRKRATLLICGIAGMTIVVLSSIYLGMYLHDIGVSRHLNERLKLYAIPNYLRSLTARPEHIDIDISFKNFQKIAYKRQEALAQRVQYLHPSPDDWVPARIRYKGETYRIDIRLKGDTSKHWSRNYGWSYKIKVKDNKTLFGMQRFAIQGAYTRSFLNEWVLHRFLEYNGLINLQFDFIDVSINGKHQFIYAIEENFEKRLIERNNYREGPIVKFQMSTLAVPFQKNKTFKDDNLAKQFKAATNLLELFRQNKLPTSKVFDIEQMARFFAIIDLWGHHHATGLSNLKLYYNPVTSLIEPICYNNQTIRPLSEEWLLGSRRKIDQETRPSVVSDNRWRNASWYDALFNDKKFFKQYIKELERISERRFLDDFFAKINKELKGKLKILYKSYPWYKFDRKQVLYENQEYIRAALSPNSLIGPPALVYFNNFLPEAHQLSLVVCNLNFLPIEILNVADEGKILFKPVRETILQARIEKESIDYSTIELESQSDFSWSDSIIQRLKINYRIVGTGKICQATIIPRFYLDKNFIADDFIRQPPNIDDFDFLIVDEKTKIISIKSGDWNLTQSLIIPKGYVVTADGGTKLNLLNTAKILTYSPLAFIGSEENPVIIHSQDSTGQGIAVINSNRESLLKYVNFENLSNPSQGQWELTGAVTFYESPAKISHCRFARNRSEDALNIIRSSFNIEHTLFEYISLDAFDVDFSKGNIINVSFLNCGNDAVDVSGSAVKMQDIFINGTGDKGISIGENTYATINEVVVKNAKMAIVSKDRSRLNINNVAISNCKVGLAVYQKKSEFGPASTIGMGLKINDVDIPYLAEEKSELIIQGEKIESDQKEVKEVLNKYLAI